MLEIRDLKKSYHGPRGTLPVLEGLSLAVGSGELVAIQGPSGCGKSTLLLSAGGLLAPDGGEVLVDGQNPYTLSPDRRARFRAATIGFVFQQFHLVPYLGVLDNVLAPSLAASVPDARRRADELIAHFNLSNRALHVPADLSIGERQRTGLARALLNRPKLLLADEPTGNLDDDNAASVFRYLAEFAQAGGAVLVVTHDVRAAESAHRTLRLKDGKLL